MNLIVFTGQNNVAMNRAVSSVAHLADVPTPRGMLNRVEAAILRPVLSCLHAIGLMPLEWSWSGQTAKLDRVVCG